MSAFTQGEKVKVTFEGTVEATPNDEWVGVRLDDGLIHWVHADEHVAKVEKVEPEYEIFGPGSMVRDKRYHNLVYTLGSDGYYSHRFDVWRPVHSVDHWKAGPFTSKDYERVEV